MAKKTWRSFEEAREFVRELRLKNSGEWQAYCKSGQKPNDIPAAPRQVYDSEYEGMEDWLGSGRITTRNRQYRPFAEAREFVRGLGLNSVREWQEYYKSGERPDDIPSDPYKVYGSEFKGFGDWLGTDAVRPQDRQYRSFEEARDFVQKLNLSSQREWRDYCRSREKPDDIPGDPRHVYGSKFKSWGDWLGTGQVATYNRQYRSFEEARDFVRKLNLKNNTEWKSYCTSGEKPNDIPANPKAVYRSDSLFQVQDGVRANPGHLG